ncbi:MAG TPA: lysylphosphatidylglycerol synthase transmembrane domain-containing protein [Syntrophorhabdaceae bacterium]|nr:lysylphosphatidylglycerol synthase transmembrane domain-containing protein [Syntrophorhabdaceae bacterium]HQM81439.1 lysylphosphatidylglycerol synthase transmembrane domain-containing protein [Syntrophorhabdaceae bacterium]
MKKHKLLTVLGLLISIVLLYFSMKDIRFREIIDTLKNADLRFAFMPTVSIFAAATLCSVKWTRIAGGNVRFSDSFIALLIGLFINNVLPARIGEIARGYVLSKRTGISLTYGITTVIIDRIFDLIGLLLITFVFFPKHSLPPRVSQAISILVLALFVLITLMVLLSRERFAGAIAGRLSRVKRPALARFGKRLIEIQENLKRIGSPLNLLMLVPIAFITWLCMAAALYFVLKTLNININVMYIPFVCVLLNMGITIPSSPGYFGLYQFLLVYLLSIFDVPKHEGFAASILFHASWYIPYNIVGFIFLIKEHLKIREIGKLEEE